MWTFNPIFKSKIWGGDRIPALKNIETECKEIGESWEISGIPGAESVVCGGPDEGLTITQLIERHGSNLLGRRNYARFGNTFPLLVKIIDAHDDLSVQVHPDDALASELGMPNGKTEMWYVLAAAPGARLASGFSRPVDEAEYEELVSSGRIEEALKFIDVKKGQIFYLPAGRVHTIGRGVLLAEIQQTSDATFRIYDYRRRDHQGRERELHTALAAKAIRFDDTEGGPIEPKVNTDIPVNVVNCPYFTTNILHLDQEVMRDYSEKDTFVVLMATEGEADIQAGTDTLRLCKGYTVLIPAQASGVTIIPVGSFTALETYMS
ncbi:MAG: class I mannose-6-phosphate isomerase [Muribaculaceae bacterium]|nr:class I mannose-6-phosphate isomerase [Muribaculaceae bacterium]